MGLLFLTGWDDATYCLSFVLFDHENGISKFLQKNILNMADSCINIKKKSKGSNNNTKKESDIII